LDWTIADLFDLCPGCGQAARYFVSPADKTRANGSCGMATAFSRATRRVPQRTGQDTHPFIPFAVPATDPGMNRWTQDSQYAPNDAAGAFGDRLAAHFHLQNSEQVSTAWPGDNRFAITRLFSNVGIPDRTTRVPSEAALHISVSILPVPLGAYNLWIDEKEVDVPYIPSLRTSVMDLESDPVCWVGAGFDYVHYHVPKAGLDEIARDHGVVPVGSYKFAICEHDIVLAQLTRYVLPLIGSSDWTGSLALDQFSLMVGAHVMTTYAGIPPRDRSTRGGLALWQTQRAAEMIRENLSGKIHLAALAQDCGLSISHFTRAFRKSFGVSPFRWLLERRIERAKALLVTADLSIPEIAVRSGFADHAAFIRAFGRIVGESPGRWRRRVLAKA
jgi:AraC family transcriptional regulator